MLKAVSQRARRLKKETNARETIGKLASARRQRIRAARFDLAARSQTRLVVAGVLRVRAAAAPCWTLFTKSAASAFGVFLRLQIPGIFLLIFTFFGFFSFFAHSYLLFVSGNTLRRILCASRPREYELAFAMSIAFSAARRH